MIHKRSTTLEGSVKKILDGLNMFDGTNLTHISDVNQDKQMFGSHERSLTYRYFEIKQKIRLNSICNTIAVYTRIYRTRRKQLTPSTNVTMSDMRKFMRQPKKFL